MKFSDFHKQMQNTTKLNLFSEHQLSIDYSLFKNSSIKDTTYFCLESSEMLYFDFLVQTIQLLKLSMIKML